MFPSIETARLRLRPLREADVADVFAVAGDDAVMRTYDWDTFRSNTEALDFIRDQQRRFDGANGFFDLANLGYRFPEGTKRARSSRTERPASGGSVSVSDAA